MRIAKLRGLSLAALVLIATGCGTLSVTEEKQLGHRVQRSVRESTQLMRDRVVVNYVRDFGAKLIQATKPSPFEFRFFVVEDPDLNAFAVPGGAIYVHTGLIEAVASASELAGVLAHEVGHVTERHVAQNYKRQRNTGVVANVLSFVIAVLTGSQVGAQTGQVLTGVAAQSYLSTFTRDAEREADAVAIDTLIAARFSPYGMITMFETLKKESRGGFKMPQFLSSHPATDERIQSVKARIRERNLPPDLRTDDGGRLEIIQERIRLIIGTDEGSVVREDDSD